MKLFDSNVYLLHQTRAQKTFSNHAFLFNHVRDDLIGRLQDMKTKFPTVLNLSPHPLPFSGYHHVSIGQPLPFEGNSFDLILSCLQAHWMNDFPLFLKNIYTCLKEDGFFLGALWGGQTLYELRESLMKAEIALTGGASPRIAPMLHPIDAPTLLIRSGFFMPVVDTDTITVTYPSLISLMKDLRGMGETNKLYARPKEFTSRQLFEKTEKIYRESFEDRKGKIRATFEVIFLSGWKHELPSLKKREGSSLYNKNG